MSTKFFQMNSLQSEKKQQRQTLERFFGQEKFHL